MVLAGVDLVEMRLACWTCWPFRGSQAVQEMVEVQGMMALESSCQKAAPENFQEPRRRAWLLGFLHMQSKQCQQHDIGCPNDDLM